ncbi:hypothetical protein BpJC7_30690 [Weizmannia acidilactici]|uniref:Sporulation inhibitor of replication protein SirA n=1 Tax=Weizmannia acidilactici TaxID=2607726 RepID=A0A5J4JAH9_9BACI|nr:sporulation inhibitor of replication protein SirA [Weizmannia acidilactici]GER68588.1 hypothetical protein BpJC4_30590 [Weizmannia acidilactici]GER71766.1 hypothetical protein BpJC7_30690 [Weizmannia acidilactici]GER73703.1 hypothetical protein BpPP18_17700 [Weizmannia acidilactici]
MRTYYIYLIEEEIAQYYYGRERMFFDLFNQYSSVTGRLKNVIRQQIDYITKPIPLLSVQHVLQQIFPNQNEMVYENGAYRLISNKKGQYAEVNIEQRLLRLHASGSYDTETAIFETLRKFNGNLLAIDYDNKRFGWIKPVKERKFV